jgi:hypothetical protein
MSKELTSTPMRQEHEPHASEAHVEQCQNDFQCIPGILSLLTLSKSEAQ